MGERAKDGGSGSAISAEAVTDRPPEVPLVSGVRAAVRRSSNLPTPARPPPLVGNYIRDLDQGPRRRMRRQVDAEVEIYGHWFFGRLVAIDGAVILVSGVHPFMHLDGAECRLRLVFSQREREEIGPPVRVHWESYDTEQGRARLRLVDPADAEVLASFA